jgi:hypothetical protein
MRPLRPMVFLTLCLMVFLMAGPTRPVRRPVR